jgi:hypothetical protein
MASRPFTDITSAQSGTSVIKNGTAVVTCSNTGEYSKLDTYVLNTPILTTIDDKYGYRFYNGVFVNIVASGTA